MPTAATSAGSPTAPEAEVNSPGAASQWSVNCTRGIASRLDRLAQEHGGSRQRLLTWLLDAHDQIMAAEAELAPERAALSARERAVSDAEHKLRAAQRELEEAVMRERRRLGLSNAAWDLLTELLEGGVGKPEVLEVCDVIREAKVEPALLAKILRKTMGLLAYAEQLEATVSQARALRDQALGEAGGARQGVVELQEQAERLTAQVAQSEEQLAAAREHLVALQDVCREVGLYLDLSGGRRLDDLSARAGRLLIGCCALLYGQLHPSSLRRPLVLPPNAQLGRFVPAPISIAELPGLLGAAGDYQQMIAALRQRGETAQSVSDLSPREPQAEEPDADEK